MRTLSIQLISVQLYSISINKRTHKLVPTQPSCIYNTCIYSLGKHNHNVTLGLHASPPAKPEDRNGSIFF